MQTSTEDPDLFTPTFKYFRRLPDADCYQKAFSINSHPNLFQRCQSSITFPCDPSLGLQPVSNWSLYACQFSDGLFFLSNPFTKEGQRQWIDRCVNDYSRQNRTSVGENSNNQNLSRLRWATLGYHYDWTEKVYRPDDYSMIPKELNELCQIVMKYISACTNCSMMKAEAVIVNYYHMNSTLCAHTDHSEVDALTKPLLSFSFGNAAIFLIGDRTKSLRPPSSLLLRSGDILLMTGASRLCYHGIPRILSDPFLIDLFDEVSNDREKSTSTYIRDKRININVRQVYTSVEDET